MAASLGGAWRRGPTAIATPGPPARVLAESSEVRGALAAPSATTGCAAPASTASSLFAPASAPAPSAAARGHGGKP